MAARSHGVRRDALEAAAKGSRDRISKAWVSRCLSEVIGDSDAAVLSELGCPLDTLTLRKPDTWYQEPHSGGSAGRSRRP